MIDELPRRAGVIGISRTAVAIIRSPSRRKKKSRKSVMASAHQGVQRAHHEEPLTATSPCSSA